MQAYKWISQVYGKKVIVEGKENIKQHLSYLKINRSQHIKWIWSSLCRNK